MEVELFMAGRSDGGRPIMPVEIYNAGEYLFPNKTDVYILGYNRLLSYGYQKKLVDSIIAMDLLINGLQGANEERGERVDGFIPCWAGKRNNHGNCNK